MCGTANEYYIIYKGKSVKPLCHEKDGCIIKKNGHRMFNNARDFIFYPGPFRSFGFVFFHIREIYEILKKNTNGNYTALDNNGRVLDNEGRVLFKHPKADWIKRVFSKHPNDFCEDADFYIKEMAKMVDALIFEYNVYN